MTDTLTADEIAALPGMVAGATPGPWSGHNMVHADTGEQMTPEELGDYVCNSVKMGDYDRFLFVSGRHDNGMPADVCHTGNGPKGPYNTALIALTPRLAVTVTAQQREIERLREELSIIAESADDDDGWTSDGHERCTEIAADALTPQEQPHA
ncbi:MAG: hypothetical protein ACK4NW_01905 [Roseinatronobacter sp.]